MKITLRLYQAIQATSDVINCPELFKAYQCVRVALSTLNRKCVLDRNVRVKTFVLNGSVG